MPSLDHETTEILYVNMLLFGTVQLEEQNVTQSGAKGFKFPFHPNVLS